ncbi:hypothetical protein AB3Y40_04250 [Yoonia sp. R2331]|uniref:hypothetical protein n=1 Tax=Yoonia sp. R2331 TaxID=3237238 RepID=UPI0034E3B621
MTRITMTSAMAALTISFAPPAMAYPTAPESTVTLAGVVQSDEACTLTDTEKLAALLNVPLTGNATC